MAFETEEISAADQERVGFPHLTDSSERTFSPYRWTVDQSADIYLIASSNRDRDNPSETRFVLGWKGHQFKIDAIGEATGEIYSGLHWVWRLTSSLTLPAGGQVNRDDVLAGLRAALTAYSGRIHPVLGAQFDF